MCTTSKKVTVLFCNDDINEFLSLAAEEGWISDAWELEFLRRTFPSGCLVCRNKGIPVAFLTSIKHGRSGWIGNLLVRKEWQGQGLGSALFQRALEVLDEAGTRTVWLTASVSGRPIYERQGFIAIDTVNRWHAQGRFTPVNDTADGFAEILALDEAGWGDSRETLLRATIERGRLSLLPDGFMAQQGEENAVMIGPWGSRNPKTATKLLQQRMIPEKDGSQIFLDVPSKNRDASELLLKTGFTVESSSTLMYRGDKPDYAPEYIYALASMGSMG
ncbi:MAG: GNAT family N-acetyltransferase [Geobacter sp.]|nr:MAG: GNAT family N-acetyltransferase [Geobacter sp.]